MPKKYNVSFFSIAVEVEAEDEDDAMNKALEEIYQGNASLEVEEITELPEK